MRDAGFFSQMYFTFFSLVAHASFSIKCPAEETPDGTDRRRHGHGEDERIEGNPPGTYDGIVFQKVELPGVER